MNLENTTDSLCDQLKEFVAKQMEKERRAEIEEAARQAANAIAAKEAAKAAAAQQAANAKIPIVMGVLFLVTVFLVALGFLFYYLWLRWKSKRAGPVTRTPKTPIIKKNVDEYNKNKISRAKVYYNKYSSYANLCTGKLKEIMRVVFDLSKDTPVFLSSTTRVISIEMDGFSNGEEFHDFKPDDGVISDSHFTYQIFGDDTIQVTRYVVGSKSYVAGFCIYVKNDSVWEIEINMNVINKLMEEEKYPGKEAAEKELNEELKDKKADKDIAPSEFTSELRERTSEKSGDVPPSYSLRAGPVTRFPKTPINKKNLREDSRTKISRAKVYEDSYSYYSNGCTEKLKEIMRVVFNLKKDSQVSLSSFTRVISIRMDRFRNGSGFHEFKPADGEIPESHFTYQIFGNNTIQVTRYVVGNKSYVAGFCIYIKNNSVEEDDISMNIIKNLMNEEKYPGKEAAEKELKEELEIKKTENEEKYPGKEVVEKEELDDEKAGNDVIPSKFTFKCWKRASQKSGTKTEQSDVPPSYSSLSIV